MPRVMLTLHLKPANASLAHVKKTLGLSADQVDEDFGLVNISPDEHLYTILVDEEAAARVEGMPSVRGTFSNPKIVPFGPPQK